MKRLIKWIWIAVLPGILMHLELEAAPQGTTADDILPKKLDFDPKPEYEVHVHPYPENLLPTSQHPLKNMTALDVLKYADNVFDFVKVVDQDKILATDVLDDSWKGWLKYFHNFLPVMNLFQVKESNDIENPSEDAPISMLDQILFKILRRVLILRVKEEEEDEESDDCEEEEPDFGPQYTSIKFDPLGNFANGILQVLKYYTGYETIQDWFKRIEEEFQNYSAFTEEVKNKQELRQDVVDAALEYGGVVSFPLPESILTIARFDPLALGINALFFIGFHLFLWGVFVPISAYASFFADIEYDYDEDTSLEPPEMEEEGEANDEEGGGDNEQDPEEADDDQQTGESQLAEDFEPPPSEPADNIQPPSMDLSDNLQPPPTNGLQANFGQQDQSRIDDTRGGSHYNYHNQYNNGYNNYNHGNYNHKYVHVPRPYHYLHNNHNGRRESVSRPQYFNNIRNNAPTQQYTVNRKMSQSSNYYTQGGVGPHEAYTLQDSNIYPN